MLGYKYAFHGRWDEFRIFFSGFHIEVVFLGNSCGMSFRRGAEYGWLHVAIPYVFSVYLAIHALRIRKYKEDCEKEIGISVFDGGIWWNLWTPYNSWSSTTPRWRHGCWHPLDTMLGRTKHREIRVIEDKTVDIPMPEGPYPAHVVIKEEGWKRPRWFEMKLVRAHVDMLVPIPHSGKGENSWDCGEDGTYGLCCPAKTIPELVGKMVEGTMKTRIKRGDSWKYPTYKTLEQYTKEQATRPKYGEANAKELIQ